MNNRLINILLYVYNAKDLSATVSSIVNSTKTSFHLTIIDQSSTDKFENFKDIHNISYSFVKWFSLKGPCHYKKMFLENSKLPYTLFITEDTLLVDGWDLELIDFVEKNKAVVSGKGLVKIIHDGNFFLKREVSDSNIFSISNFIDRNFVFFKTEIVKSVGYPSSFKYYGEEEMLSLNLFCNDIDIYSAPSRIYSDLEIRSLENKFKQFSLVHNYNMFMDKLKKKTPMTYTKRDVNDFIKFHSINLETINHLPYETNDVTYDNEYFEIQNSGDTGKRFLALPKAMY